MSNLKGSGSNDIGLNYKSILNIGTATNGLGTVSSTLQNVTDGDGNVTALSLSTAFVKITGDGVATGGFVIGNSATQSGALTVKGTGGNIFSGRSSTDVQKFYIGDSGNVVAINTIEAPDMKTANLWSSIIMMRNSAYTGAAFVILGLNTNAFPALKANGSTLEFKLGDDSAYTGIRTSGIQLGSLFYDTTSIYSVSVTNARFNIQNGGYTIEVNASGAIDSSALFQINSTSKGFLPPRMTTTQRTAISSPATGLMVFDTTLDVLMIKSSTTWLTL